MNTLCLILVIVLLALPAPMLQQAQDEDISWQTRIPKKEWLLNTESGIPFWMAGNFVICTSAPADRVIFVFMEAQSFSVESLQKVFRYLSEKNPQPKTLTIFARTDSTVLQKWIDLYQVFVPTRYETLALSMHDTREDDLFEETKLGSYQAELFRSFGNEFISYSLDTATGKRHRFNLLYPSVKSPDTSPINSELLDAAKNGCVECVRTLLDKGADVNWKDKYGMSPLLAAVYQRRAEIVHLLLDGGADINVTSYDGWTPLLCAANSPFGERLAIELVRRGANVNAKSRCGDTALTLAVQMGVEEPRLVEELLNKGADFDIKDRFGRSVLQIAEDNHHKAIITMLKKKGAQSEE